MATIKEYCEKLSTSQLQALLREEFAGRGALTVDAVLLICEIIAARIPTKPPVSEKIRELCGCYMEE